MSDIVEWLRGEVPHCDEFSNYDEWELRVLEAADEIERLREALDAAHYYIDASDCELKLEGITRDDTLSKARELREAVWGWKHRAALGEGK